jgi:membrane-anchored mycosin MYCP
VLVTGLHRDARRRRLLALAAVAGLLLGPAAAGRAAVAAAELPALPATTALVEGPDCREVSPEDRETEPITGPNDPYDAMHVARAQELAEARTHRAPGDGVRVVVVDSGAAPAIPVVHQRLPTSELPELVDPHGSIATGVIAGPDQRGRGAEDVPVDIAPGADVVDLRVYDRRRGADPADDGSTLSTEAVVAGLRWTLQNARGPRTIVLVPLAVAETRELRQAVAALARAGVLVVAPAGDRPESAEDVVLGMFFHEDGVPPGEDAAEDVWPAGYDSVLTVGVVDLDGGDVTDNVLQNSQVDIAAPTLGGASYAANGRACALTTYSSEVAAAQVAAVAALVWSVHTQDDAAALRERLLRTADGSGASDSPVTGYGMIQPVEAIQRTTPRDGGKAGARADQVGRAPAPVEEADLLASARRNAVRWGLVGGGLVVIALVLRPVLVRRRGDSAGS